MAKRTQQQPFESLRVIGGLLNSQLLTDMRAYALDHQSREDYGLVKGLQRNDEITRYWRIARAHWADYRKASLRDDAKPTALAQSWIKALLEDVLGYRLEITKTQTIGERSFPLRLNAHNGTVPIVVCGAAAQIEGKQPEALDTPHADFGQDERKRAPAAMLQEYLNAAPNALWAIASDGLWLRLYRDNPAMTRPAYLEVDFQRLFDEDNLGDFAALWLLLHHTRTAPRVGSDGGNAIPDLCILEHWRGHGQKTGERALDALRGGVSEALRQLGTGFVAHPGNIALREALQSGDLSRDDYYNQLLRLVYRLLFLLTAERREVALLPGEEHATARELYQQGYSLNQLAERSGLRRHHDQYDDAWQQLQVTFSGFAIGQLALAQPALGGLFSNSQCPDLDTASIDNDHLFEALRRISWFDLDGVATPINYRDMGTEEFGSVYESLLEQVPQLHAENRWRFSFVGDNDNASTAGNARKTTGSYYTPDSLVQELIKSALDPVISQRLAERTDDPEAGLLALRIVDPACGSGHFLLAAARRVAAELANVRATDGSTTPEDYRHALRDVISHCIFGVDRNPMALELARTALWLEGVEPGKPLSFLDHHLQCGDALLGLTDLGTLELGIPKAAFKALSGDDKQICSALNKRNTEALKDLARKRNASEFLQVDEWANNESDIEALRNIEAMPQQSTADTSAKETAYSEFLQQGINSPVRRAADLVLGAFLLPKTSANHHQIPTADTVYLELNDEQSIEHHTKVTTASDACAEARVLHWPLAFPQVFAQGGFDCVLGNPPWEHVELKEEEFFGIEFPAVAEAKNKAERTKRIEWLSEGMLMHHLNESETSFESSVTEKQVYQKYSIAKRSLDAASAFAHVKSDEGGRFPLTGKGRVNTYALFAETMLTLKTAEGRAGVIVQSGIATDDSTKDFFGYISTGGQLVSLFDFENREKLFPAVDSRMKFCLLTLGYTESAEFAFFASQVHQLADPRRRFRLTPDEFRLINPNTLTCPVFRSQRDAELTKKLYRAAPVLIDETRTDGNPWGISFMQGTHNMSSDSHLFKDAPGEGLLPLYEAKMINFYNHRAGTYEGRENGRGYRILPAPSARKINDPSYEVEPFYWVSIDEIKNKLKERWEHEWLYIFKDVTAVTNERTVISSVIPISAVGHTAPIILPCCSPDKSALLIGNINSIILDYVARQKIGGLHLTYTYVRQFPVVPANAYSQEQMKEVIERVIELTYTSNKMAPWAADLGYTGAPFPFDPDRRAQLRAELDAYYAKLYGLTRDELRYILDPADIMGQDYPSETFRVLKNKEMREYGEYRTQRLVLEAWDKLESGELQQC